MVPRIEKKEDDLHKKRAHAEDLIKKFLTLLNQSEEYKDQIHSSMTASAGKAAGRSSTGLMDIIPKEGYGPAFMYFAKKDAKVKDAINDFFGDIAKKERPAFSLPGTESPLGYSIEDANLEKAIDKLEIRLGLKSKALPPANLMGWH